MHFQQKFNDSKLDCRSEQKELPTLNFEAKSTNFAKNKFNKFFKIIEIFIESEFEYVCKNFKMGSFERKNKCLSKLKTLTSKASRKLLDFYKSATSSNIASFF